MPRAKPILTSFNGGELSPLLDGRVDQDKYFTGCKTLTNFIPTVQGPARRRGGTRFVGLVKVAAKRAWLADFVFSAGQAYALEFGDNYLRFWTNRGQLLGGDGVSPYEVVTPYSEADLITAEGTFALRTLQSSDVMWIVHSEGKHPPYRLSRRDAIDWTLAPEEFTDGPFRDVNTDSALTMQAGGTTGTVTVTANSALFKPGHVGSLLVLNSFNPSTVAPYQTYKSVSIGDRVRNAGNVYEAQNAFTYASGDQTQRYVPTHTEGDAYDGAVTWRYLHSGYGWGKIISVSGDGLSCQLQVISRLPDEVSSSVPASATIEVPGGLDSTAVDRMVNIAGVSITLPAGTLTQAQVASAIAAADFTSADLTVNAVGTDLVFTSTKIGAAGNGSVTVADGSYNDAPAYTLPAIPLSGGSGTGVPTRRWAFSEFSSVYGWPTGIAFFKERLTYTRGKQVFHSIVGAFTNFARKDAGSVTSETAMSLSLAADKLDSIRWLAQSRTLVIGSARAELALGEQTTQQVYSATNVQNVPQTEYGSRLLRPLRVGESVLFVERAGHRIRDMKFDFTIDRYKAEDITVLSEHIFDGSEALGDPEQEQRDIVDWAYQQQRDSIVWCVLSDGTVASLVFNRERGVIAWTPHYLGGNAVVEAVQSIPSPDGRTDDAWFIVRRTVNGQTQRSVEYLTDYRLVKKGAAEAVHVDCSTTYRGAATKVVTGLAHLEGQTVSVCVDGSNHPDKVVSGGQVTLDRTGELIHIGYRFVSRMQTMRLEVQGGGGTSQTTRKGIAEVWLRLQSTIGGRVGPTFDRMDEIRTLDPRKPVGTPPALYSGDYKLQFPGGYETDAYVCYEQRMPLPATLVAVVLRVQIND